MKLSDLCVHLQYSGEAPVCVEDDGALGLGRLQVEALQGDGCVAIPEKQLTIDLAEVRAEAVCRSGAAQFGRAWIR